MHHEKPGALGRSALPQATTVAYRCTATISSHEFHRGGWATSKRHQELRATSLDGLYDAITAARIRYETPSRHEGDDDFEDDRTSIVFGPVEEVVAVGPADMGLAEMRPAWVVHTARLAAAEAARIAWVAGLAEAEARQEADTAIRQRQADLETYLRLKAELEGAAPVASGP